MSVIQYAVKGIRESSARPKMIVLLWVFNLLTAGICTFVFLRVFGGAVGASALVGNMAEKADMNVVVEFLTSAHGGAVTELVLAVLVSSALYLFVSVFLHGGILQTLIQKGGKWRFAETFFAGGGRFYGRFFRLEIYSLALWLTAGMIFILINTFINFNYRESADERTTFALTIIKVLFALFLVFLIKMMMDYARILIAGRDSRDVLRSLLEAVRFVLKNPGKTLALYYLLGLAGWAAFLIYKVLDSAFPQSSAVTIALGFLLAQVFIASRGWLRIAYQAAQGRVIGLI